MATKMIKVVMLVDTILPRFILKKGEAWDVRAERLTTKGFPCGNGFVESGRFQVIYK